MRPIPWDTCGNTSSSLKSKISSNSLMINEKIPYERNVILKYTGEMINLFATFPARTNIITNDYAQQRFQWQFPWMPAESNSEPCFIGTGKLESKRNELPFSRISSCCALRRKNTRPDSAPCWCKSWRSRSDEQSQARFNSTANL